MDDDDGGLEWLGLSLITAAATMFVCYLKAIN
jgi:hypothetical protein